MVSVQKEQNEELNWAVNYELGMLDPFMEDPEHVPEGKNSQKNSFYPYKNEIEMNQALKLLIASENITSVSWSLWIGMQMDLQDMVRVEETSTSVQPSPNTWPRKKLPLGPSAGNSCRQATPEVEEVDLTVSPARSSRSKPSGFHKFPTSPSPLAPNLKSKTTASSPTTDKGIVSYKTLPDFYSLLDQIERTSFVGALFLEAYAERLRDDLCRECWRKRYVVPEGLEPFL
jgi:hypothetical protein